MSTDVEDEDPPTQRPQPLISDDEFWLVSYAEDDDRELTTKEIVAAMKRGEITLSTLVWRDSMAEWQPIASIDELRTRAGFIVQPFMTDAPPRSEPENLKAIAALSGDIEELSSSEVHSSPPSSLAEADFLGLDEPDASLAPPRIDHAAFFKSDPPPNNDPKKKAAAALPGLPALGGKPPAPSAVAAAAAKPAQTEGGGLKWILVVCTAIGAAVAGFMLAPSDDPPPAQPVAQASEPAEPIPAAANPTAASEAVPAQDVRNPSAPAVPPQPPEQAAQPPQVAQPTQAARATQPAAVVATQPAGQASSPTSTPPSATPGTATAEPKPAAAPPPPRATSTAPFDKAAAGAALTQAAAQASSCRQPGDPSGTAQVEVTFASSGRATRAIIGGPPFRGTATGSCIAQTMRSAMVPPFAGDLVTVQKRVVIQ